MGGPGCYLVVDQGAHPYCNDQLLRKFPGSNETAKV